MKETQKNQAAVSRRAAARRSKAIRWMVGLGAVALIGYGLSQMSNIAYDAEDLAVVDFSDLTSKQKRTALEAANGERCTCGCGMTLAQCVATDSTCPIRQDNIDKLKRMVNDAARSKS